MTDIDDSEVARVAAGLSKAQRAIILLDAGEYQHPLDDIAALMNAKICGTTLTLFGLAVRAYLQSKGGEA